MVNMIPVYIMFALSLMGLGIYLAQHGKPKKGNENFWTALVSVIMKWILLAWAFGWIF